MENSYQDTEEKVLIKLVAEGDMRAFQEIYYRYEKQLHFFARKLTRSTFRAEEIVQDTFVKIWETRERIKGVKSFEAYVYRIVGNRAADEIRKLARLNKLKEVYKQTVSYASNQTEHTVIFSELETEMGNIIEQLPDQNRKIYFLYYRDGKSHEEIAGLLGINKRTVQNQLYLAMSSIRNKLQPHMEITILGCLILLSTL